MSAVATFSHPVGSSHLYSFKAIDSGGDLVSFQGDVSYVSDNPSVASVTPNPAVSQQTQATINYLTPGVANVTASAQDTAGNPFSAMVQVTVTTGLAVSFAVTELN